MTAAFIRCPFLLVFLHLSPPPSVPEFTEILSFFLVVMLHTFTLSLKAALFPAASAAVL